MFRTRLQFLAFVYTLIVIGLGARLYQLQIVRGDYYRNKTENRPLDIRKLESRRGSIVDRNGEVLASDSLVWNVSLYYDDYDRAVQTFSDLRKWLAIPKKIFKSTDSNQMLAPYVQGLSVVNRQRILEKLAFILSVSEAEAETWMQQESLTVAELKKTIISTRQKRSLANLSQVLSRSVDGLQTAINSKRDELQQLIDRKWLTRRAWRRPQVIVKDISKDQAHWIELHHESFAGLNITSSLKRVYPQGDCFSNITGYINRITATEYQAYQSQREEFEGFNIKVIYPEDMVGRTGLERRYEDMLKGKRGLELVVRNAQGHVQRVLSERYAQNGADIRLTLDSRLQRVAMNAFQSRAARGAMVVIDVRSGELLAVLTYPSYDANIFVPPTDTAALNQVLADTTANRRRAAMLNRAVTAQYPPGSVMKIPLALAGLESGFLTAEHLESCLPAGRSPVGDMKCNSVHYDVDLNKAIQKSCNIYFYNLAYRMGIDRMSPWYDRFGFGQLAGKIPGETKGLIGNRNRVRELNGQAWSGGDTMNMSIGQGYTLVSPLQVARFMAMVANGGRLHNVRLVKQVGSKEQIGDYQDVELNQDNLRLVKDAMILVTQAGGTASRSDLARYKVAGKTGTAEVARRAPHAWFAGYAPYDKPEIAFAIIVENGGHGGDVAAPIAKDVLEHYFATESVDEDD